MPDFRQFAFSPGVDTSSRVLAVDRICGVQRTFDTARDSARVSSRFRRRRSRRFDDDPQERHRIGY